MKITTEAELDQVQHMVQRIFDDLRQELRDGEAGDVDIEFDGRAHVKETTPEFAYWKEFEPTGWVWTIRIDQNRLDANDEPLHSIHGREEQYG